MMNNKIVGSADALYLHIPFCKTICHYCDFKKMIYNESFFYNFFENIKKEINSEVENKKLKTIYIGGGTPTALSLNQLEEVLLLLKPYSYDVVEYTIESNIENINYDLCKLLKKYNINRLSLGVQSLDEKILKLTNRKHTKETVFKALNTLAKYDFNNISIDLIYGFNELTNKQFINDIISLSKFDNVKHFSIYSLTVEEGTYFSKIKYESLVDEATFYLDGRDTLEKLGYQQYEVANYAKKGYESNHNKVYWQYKDYYGIGSGASGKINNIRYSKINDINKPELEIEELNKTDIIFEHLMMNLRLLEGIDLRKFNNTYDIDLLNDYYDIFKDLLNTNLEVVNGYLRCKKEKIIVLNDILVKLYTIV